MEQDPQPLVQTPAAPPEPKACCPLLVIGVWYGIAAGITEGALLLLFERLNWAEWARMMHVSVDILWVSPVVDLLLFTTIAAVVWCLSRLFRAMPARLVLGFVLTGLAVYDWLELTDRLYHRACLLLSLGAAVAFLRWLRRHEAAICDFWRRSAPVLVGVLVVLFVGIKGGSRLAERRHSAQLPEAGGEAPNIVVIVIDTLRADHLSSYGYARPTSPVIDRIASQGVLFENAIAASSWSLPSHASLITGRYPSEHGLENVLPMPWLGWGRHSLGGYETLAEALDGRGYRTGAFSANRVYFTRGVGMGRGFMHFEDYFDSGADCFVRTVFGRVFARFYLNRTEKSKVTRLLRYLGMDSLLDKDSEGSGDYGGAYGVRKRAGMVNQEVLDWVDRDRGHPFFAFLNYLDVHYAYGGPRGYPKPAWDHGTVIDEYDAGLKYVDDSIGQLESDLERRGGGRETLLIVTSDHGESLGDHGLSYHGASLYRELIRVPLVISYPGHIPGQVRVERPVTNSAIASTILAVLPAARSEQTGRGPSDERNPFPGPPLSELWQGSALPGSWPNPISQLAETNIIVREDRVMEGKIPLATNGSMQSVVTPRWHLIVHQTLGRQLYDWTRDPGELQNLAQEKAGSEVAVGLLPELQPKSTSAAVP
jgi:arylsulfatase A-like enzyme